MRHAVWEKLSEKFGDNERKLQLKWKNLKRKYILMRYPQSSKNSITQKRKIRYSPKFVDKMKFLDKYLEYSQRYSPVDNSDVYEICLKKMKMEIPEEPHEVIESSDTTNLSAMVEETSEIVYEDSDMVHDPENGQFTLTVEEEQEENYEEIDLEENLVGEMITKYPNESAEDQTETAEDQIESAEDVDEELMTSEEPESQNEVTMDRRCENEIFCLSLVDSINRFSYQKQLLIKAKIWQLLAEEASNC